MIAITKSMVALSVLMSAGLVAAIDITGQRSETPATQVAQRFPLPGEMFAPVSMGSVVLQKVELQAMRGDRLPLSEPCAQQDWPYLSHQCLTSGDGTVRKVIRVITIERRVGETTSELVRMPVADVAQR